MRPTAQHAGLAAQVARTQASQRKPVIARMAAPPVIFSPGSLAGLGQGGQDRVEVVDPGVLDDDPALAALVFDGDFQPEASPKLVLRVPDVGIHGFSRLFRLCLSFGVEQTGDQALGSTNVQSESEDPLCGGSDGFGGRQGEQLSAPASTICCTSSGRRSRRRKLATVARSLPVRSAICSWVR